jgi:hypothetical protein
VLFLRNQPKIVSPRDVFVNRPRGFTVQPFFSRLRSAPSVTVTHNTDCYSIKPNRRRRANVVPGGAAPCPNEYLDCKPLRVLFGLQHVNKKPVYRCLVSPDKLSKSVLLSVTTKHKKRLITQ